MIATMPKKKLNTNDAAPAPKGRAAFKYVGLPVDLYDLLKEFADADDRTVNGVAKRAIREYLSQHRPGDCKSSESS